MTQFAAWNLRIVPITEPVERFLTPKVFHKTFFNVVGRADGIPAQSERRGSSLTFPSQSNVSEANVKRDRHAWRSQFLWHNIFRLFALYLSRNMENRTETSNIFDYFILYIQEHKRRNKLGIMTL